MEITLQTPAAVVQQHTRLQGVPFPWQRRHLHTPALAMLRGGNGLLVTIDCGHLITDADLPVPLPSDAATPTALLALLPLLLTPPHDRQPCGHAMAFQHLGDGLLQRPFVAVLAVAPAYRRRQRTHLFFGPPQTLLQLFRLPPRQRQRLHPLAARR